MADAAQEELPEGFHLRGQKPNVIMDSSGQRVILASIPITKNGPLNSTSFYDADYHSYFTPTIMKSIGEKECKERTCCFCMTTINITSNQSTMRNHFQSDAYWKTHMLHVDLRSWPRKLVDEVRDKWKAAVAAATGETSATKRKAESGGQQTLDKVVGKKFSMIEVRTILTEAIVRGGIIVTMMENPGYRYLVQRFAFQGDDIPRGLSSRSIQRSIFNMYTECFQRAKEEVMEIMLAQPGMLPHQQIVDYHQEFGAEVTDADDPMVNTRRLSLIQDTWSGRNKLGFLAVLAQVMDCRSKDKWSLRCQPLSCRLFRSPHTIERCREEILTSLQSADLSWFYARSCTQDTTASSIGVCKMVPHVGRVPCFAHTAQLMLKHSAENSPIMTDMLSACNHVSVSMNRPKRLQMLHDQQIKDRAKQRNTVSLADTRWNSVQIQIASFMAVMPSLCTVVATKLDDIFTDDDDKKHEFVAAWNKLTNEGGMEALTKLVVFLDLAASWTHALCSKTVVTASLVIPATLSLQAGIQQLLDDSAAYETIAMEKTRQSRNPNVIAATRTELESEAQRASKTASALKEYANAALQQWERYFGKHYTNQWYWLIASLLDPRVFRNSMNGEQMTNAVLAAKGWVALSTETELPMEDEAEDAADGGVNAQQHDHFTAFAQTIHMATPAPSVHEHALPPFDTEMMAYHDKLKVMQPETCAGLDPLEFWATASNMPSLRRIASIVLAIPATSGMAEQLFSTAGWLLSPRRSRLSPDMLNKLVFLYYYKRSEMAKSGELKDKREIKRRKVSAALAKVQVSKVRNSMMLLPGNIEDDNDDDDDDDEAGQGHPPPDARAVEEDYDAQEEDDKYERDRQVADEQRLHEAHILNAARIERELTTLQNWLQGADSVQVQGKLDDLEREKTGAGVARAFELRNLITATKTRLTLLTGKRARGRHR